MSRTINIWSEWARKKATEDKNLDLQIDFAIDDKARTLRVGEVSRMCYANEAVPLTAHAALPYARNM